MVGTFSEDTQVEHLGEGRYRAHLSDRWNLRPLPQGGVVTAVGLRAMAAELGIPEQQLRTSHTTFAAQVTDGPLEIDVEVLRRGRTMSQVRAEVRNPGQPRGHLTVATFGTVRTGPAFTDLGPPTVPPPADCWAWRDVPNPEPMPFWDSQVESRGALGTPPWEAHQQGPAERATWARFDTHPLLPSGEPDPLGLAVLADVMPGAVWPKLPADHPPWFGPSVDLTLHLLAPWRTEWVLCHNRARWADDGYASADMALWALDEGPPQLVAYATQVFFFVPLG